MIGAIFERVWPNAAITNPPQNYVQTIGVPAGSATVVDMTMRVPGEYALVDHSIFRIDKGAVGFLNVSGKPNHQIYTSNEPQYRCSGCKTHT